MTRAAWAFGILSLACSAGDDLPAISPEDFARLRGEILPQPGESPWRDVAWLTSVREARERSVAEDKPIVIFTAADGSPLSRT
jgi:hypothetical protein